MLDLSVLDLELSSQLGIAFLAGLLTFFTPCVYPLVPITLAIFSGPSEDGSQKTCKLKSVLYALGIATTYTTLGILAAQCGLVFGAYIGSPYFLAMIMVVLLAMTFSTLGIIELPFLHQLQSIGCKIRHSGKRGAFFSGLGSGLIAAPCVGPTLVAILTLAASHQKPILGSIMMAFYALGFSLPFVALGTFSQLVQKLPPCGKWMMCIKGLIASGIILTLMFLFSGHVDWALTKISKEISTTSALAAGILGVVIIFYSSKLHKPWVSLLGCLLLSTALYSQFLFMPSVAKDNQLKWSASLSDALQVTANSENQIVMVKSFTDWCGSCRELEEKTFSSQHVQNALKNYVLVGLNFSDITPEISEFSDHYNVVGVPTMIFLKKDGTEIKGSRISGFVTAQQLVNHLEHLRSHT